MIQQKSVLAQTAIQKWYGKAPATLAAGESVTKFIPLK